MEIDNDNDNKKGKKTGEMHDAISHHLLTNARPPFLNPDWCPSR